MATSHIETGRSTVYSNGGVVVSISPLAASAGARVLADGGNAFDAAVAVAAVEAVTVPPACGVGGEPFVIMRHAKTGDVHGLSGSGRAPMAVSREFFTERGHKFMPLVGPTPPPFRARRWLGRRSTSDSERAHCPLYSNPLSATRRTVSPLASS